MRWDFWIVDYCKTEIRTRIKNPTQHSTPHKPLILDVTWCYELMLVENLNQLI